VPGCEKVCSYIAPLFDSGGFAHPVFDGEQKRPSALPSDPLTTLCPLLDQTQRTVSPAWTVRFAGANVKPSLPTWTTCVRGPAIVVVVAPAAVVVVTAPGQVPALQLSQQLGTVPTHAEPPLGALHLDSLGTTEHLVRPVAFVRQHVTKAGLPQVDLRAQPTTLALHCFGRVPLLAAVFAAWATHRTYAL
jgi:hypothetical protein